MQVETPFDYQVMRAERLQAAMRRHRDRHLRRNDLLAAAANHLVQVCLALLDLRRQGATVSDGNLISLATALGEESLAGDPDRHDVPFAELLAAAYHTRSSSEPPAVEDRTQAALDHMADAQIMLTLEADRRLRCEEDGVDTVRSLNCRTYALAQSIVACREQPLPALTRAA